MINTYTSQGKGELGGAQFTVTYYDSIFTTEAGATGKISKKTLVYKTNVNGIIQFSSKALIVSGEPYLDIDNYVTFPLGTYVIKETTPPTGYLNDGDTFVYTVNVDGDGNKVYKYYTATGAAIPAMSTTNTRIVPENPIRGGVTGSKVLLESGDKQLGNVRLDGIKFAIISNNPGKTVKVDNVEYTNGKVVKIFTTDSNGNFRSTTNLLPYGDYTLVELRRDSAVQLGSVYANVNKGTSIYASPAGRDDVLWKEQNIPINIRNHGEIVTAGNTNDKKDIGNNDSKGRGSIVKIDSETNAAYQGDATFAGIRYALINRSTNKVVYGGTSYARGQVIAILTTDANGKASTPAKSLDFGIYELVELPIDTNINATGIKAGTTFDRSKLGVSIYANGNGYLYKAYSETKSITKDGEQVVFSNDDPVTRGGAGITKNDNDRQTNRAQGDATIAGIQYAIVNRSTSPVLVDGKTQAVGNIVMIVETDESGKFTTSNDAFPYGTYDVIELRKDHSLVVGDNYNSSTNKYGKSIYANATDSYLYRAQTKKIVVREQGKIYSADFIDPVTRGGADVYKNDADLKARVVQGDASFEGIQYAIVNRSADSVYVDGKWYEIGQVVKILTLDNNGKASTGNQLLPYGTYDVVELSLNHTVEVGKTYAASQNGKSIYANNNGYLYNADTQTIVLRKDKQVEALDFTDEVVRGTITVKKFDGETSKQEPQGACSFADIRYAIVNRSKMPVYVDGELYAVGEVVEILVTDKTGVATSKKIPYGTYDVYELRKDATILLHDKYDGSSKLGTSIYANDSYLFTDDIEAVTVNVASTYNVAKTRQILRIQDENYTSNYANFPVRGDLEQHKYDIDGYPDAYIPFRVSLLDAEGNKIESHVIIADKDGHLNTQTRGNKTPGAVNTLDQYAKNGIYTGPLDEAAASVNIWFGDQNFMMDTRGSLLYGNYIIEELQCENNLGQDMLKHEVAVYEEFKVFKPENVAVDLNIIIESQAKDVNSDSNSVSLGKEVKVSDTVQFTHLKTYNTYKLITEVFNVRKDGSKVSIGKSDPIIINPKKFDDTNTSYATIDEPVVNEFTVDTSELEPGSYIAMVDYLYYVNDEGDELLIKTHNEFCNIESQKLIVPEVTSAAHNITTKSRIGSLEPNAVIYDTVEFKNLGNKTFYRLVEELFFADGTPVKDVNGKVCRAEVRMYVDYRLTDTTERGGIVLTGMDGTYDMPSFEIKSRDLAGKTIMIKQSLMDEISETIVLIHNNELDVDVQSVRWLDISTTAMSATNVQGIVPNNTNVVLRDVIDYVNAAEDTDVVIKTKVVEKESGNTVLEKTTNSKITAGTGSITIDMTLDTTPYANKHLVVFEYVYMVVDGNEVLIAEHADINDTMQTVMVPEIGTTLTSRIAGKQYRMMKNYGIITLVDTVNYKNLKVGQPYTFVLELMDKNTGKPVYDKNGELVTASKTIVPETTSGKVDIEVTFEQEVPISTSWEADDAYVAFEEVWGDKGSDNLMYAFHKDLEDEEQTIRPVMIRTTAIGKDSKTKNVLSATNQTVVDTVELKNFAKGTKITLVIEAHDAETGDPILDVNGKVYTNTHTFKFKGQASEDVEITFNADDLGGRNVVFYEYAYVEDEIVDEAKIADETDHTNWQQTVRIPTGSTTASTDNSAKLVKETKEAHIRDTISYENVEPGTYKILGQFVRKDTQAVVAEVTKEVKITDINGTIDIDFVIDTTELGGIDLVAFETMSELNGAIIFEHKDLNDENQTVHVVKVRTTASDKADGDNIIDGTQKEQTIVDVVRYENLIVGKEYTVNGTLYVKQTGEAVVDADGNKVTASTTFIAETASGEISLEFTVDATMYAGKKLVAFESILFEDKEIGIHADIDDAEQTVNVTLLLDVRIAKADKDKVNYYLKGAEITVFNADGTIAKDIDGKECVGITDENGQVQFVLLYDEDNTYYVQETKAPAGYNINNDKFEVKLTGEDKLGVDLISINILDEVIIVPPVPQTGDNSNILLWAGLALMSMCGVVVLLLVRRRKETNAK